LHKHMAVEIDVIYVLLLRPRLWDWFCEYLVGWWHNKK
jgi:hypothetical protein